MATGMSPMHGILAIIGFIYASLDAKVSPADAGDTAYSIRRRIQNNTVDTSNNSTFRRLNFGRGLPGVKLVPFRLQLRYPINTDYTNRSTYEQQRRRDSARVTIYMSVKHSGTVGI